MEIPQILPKSCIEKLKSIDGQSFIRIKKYEDLKQIFCEIVKNCSKFVLNFHQLKKCYCNFVFVFVLLKILKILRIGYSVPSATIFKCLKYERVFNFRLQIKQSLLYFN